MTQKFVVLPVEVAERALYALQEAEMLMEHRQNVDLRLASIQSIQEALKQQNPWWYATVPAGWRLVPVEPKISMKQAALSASRRWAECDAPLPRTQELWASEVCWKAMIEAAPQPPTTEQSSAVEQPQVEQDPVAWMVTSEMQDGTRSTYPMIGRFKDVQDCCDFGEPAPLIYQHPQPKRDLLLPKS